MRNSTKLSDRSGKRLTYVIQVIVHPVLVRFPTNERQVLATLAVVERNYGALKTGWGSCQETTPISIIQNVTKVKEGSPNFTNANAIIRTIQPLQAGKFSRYISYTRKILCRNFFIALSRLQKYTLNYSLQTYFPEIHFCSCK